MADRYVVSIQGPGLVLVLDTQKIEPGTTDLYRRVVKEDSLEKAQLRCKEFNRRWRTNSEEAA